MTLDLSHVGQRIAPLEFAYTERDTSRYALGVGAPTAELEFLDEGRGPEVISTFAVIPAYEATAAPSRRARRGRRAHGRRESRRCSSRD